MTHHRPGPEDQAHGAAATALVEQALTTALTGQTGALLLEGEAGIGRTTFLVESSALARRLGFTVARGRCHPQERHHPLGVVRQVFASLLLSTPGFPGIPEVTDGGPGDPSSMPAQFDVLVGLYRSLAEAAARSPLLVVLDDLQWCDEASLRALSQLVHHGVRLRLVVLAAVRTGEPVGRSAAFQDTAGHLRRTRLAGLDLPAVAELVRTVLPGEPHPDFVAACRRSTGGNPTLVRALLDEIARHDLPPGPGTAERLLNYAPEATARDAEARIHRLGRPATAMAQAVAVLGDGADLGQAASVADLSRPEAATAVDLLIGGGVLSNHHQLTFRHQVVGAALARYLPAGTASTLRVRAARALHQAGGRAEPAVEHLLLTDPVGESWAREMLRTAGLDAAAAGRPETAVRYLTRALREPQSEAETAQLLRELGTAQFTIQLPAQVPPQRAAVQQRGDTHRPLEIRCLGSFRIARSGVELDLSGVRPKARTLLRLLAMRAGTAVHRDHLLDALWPGLPSEQGVRNLQVTVSRLRACLEPQAERGGSRFLLRSGASYQLALEPDAVCDVRAFERAVRLWRHARPAAPEQEAELLGAALRWYAGDLLPEDGAAEWVVTERARLRDQASDVCQALAEVRLGLGQLEASARAARRSLDLDPFRDASWRVLTTVYRRTGDVAAAERTRQEYERMLRSLDGGPEVDDLLVRR
ncbi:BTAD domain-containing putative transcriptional regulator [Kitasatospora sp. MAP5-34]|uniref:BTAD domain-containing putative transcriptional regulator n=1 Tax=Kitasatospora sp. MAP5-34 TaxID=3035102 RepID=UPI00247421A1|nr:BTAD domain-containing putative transcriptional regulator [Kitasatospora sp. MAP5-34]MDH6577886.1 DNA-binding SARP family transcriptional activator [Kitasatospora sp. MAP5-34]